MINDTQYINVPLPGSFLPSIIIERNCNQKHMLKCKPPQKNTKIKTNAKFASPYQRSRQLAAAALNDQFFGLAPVLNIYLFIKKQALRNSCELLRQRKELHASSLNCMQAHGTA